jgi:hypothetical protein
MFESLESRQFLSGSADVAIWTSSGPISIQTNIHITKSGTLAVEGTDSADSLSVIQDGKWIKYQTNNGGTIANFFTKAANVKRVLIEAGSGDDRVYVDPELSKPCTIVGGNGDDHIDGNFGATMIGGAGDDRLFAATPNTISSDAAQGTTFVGVTRIVGPALLSGGLGDDTLIGNDGDDFVGGTGNDTAVLYLPSKGATLGNKPLTDYFADSTGLEILMAQLGTGKDATFTGIYTSTKG